MSSLLDDINLIIPELFEERLFPCNIVRDVNGKKVVQQPKAWTDATKLYEDFELSGTNSIAVRTGKGLVVVDVDTKDLTLLEPYMKDLVNKWLSDQATFTLETTNGYHFYFDSDDKSFSNAVRVSDYVDIRGDGGCVFCYTEDPNSFYTVICEAEPLPLTEEIMEYISLKERDLKTVEYTYDVNNLKIATSSHKANKGFERALSLDTKPKQTAAILKSAGMAIADFENIDGLYTKTNALAFILAMNPSVPNAKVRVIVEYVISNYSGFDINSSESKERLHQIFSSMIYSDESEKDIREVLAQCSIDIDTNLELLHKDLLFLKHGFNLVIGESKSGKTFTTIMSLVDFGFKEDIIHIDFDRNSDKALEELNVETYHINNAKELFEKLAKNKAFEPLKEKIIVIDSLQDLGLEDGIDTNSAALDTMNRVAIFGNTGATLIVIHHVTLEKVGSAKIPKIKGNTSTISSKCDTSILLRKENKKRTMTVMFSRAENILASGKSISFNGTKKVSVLQNVIKE